MVEMIQGSSAKVHGLNMLLSIAVLMRLIAGRVNLGRLNRTFTTSCVLQLLGGIASTSSSIQETCPLVVPNQCRTPPSIGVSHAADASVHWFPVAGDKSFTTNFRRQTVPDVALAERVMVQRIKADPDCQFLGFVDYDDTRFSDIFSPEESMADRIYASVPMYDMNPSQRGFAIESVMKRFQELTLPNCIVLDGKQLDRPSSHQALSDYGIQPLQGTTQEMLRGRISDVETKNSQLQWKTTGNRFAVNFKNIKFHLHDELRLVIYAPDGLHLYTYNGYNNIQRMGQKTDENGEWVIGYSSRYNVRNWRQGLRGIHEKMLNGGCEFHGCIRF